MTYRLVQSKVARLIEERVRLRTGIAAELPKVRRPGLEPQRLITIFLDAPVAVCMMSGPDHIFTFVNDFCLELVGSHRKMLGISARLALPELESQGFGDILDRVYRYGRTLCARELRMTVKSVDGEMQERVFDFVYRPIRDSKCCTGVMFVATDVTDSVRAREKAERECAGLRAEVYQRDKILSIASHELKSPIMCLKLHLEITQRRLASSLNDGADAKKVSYSIDSSSQQVDRLRGLVDDLMDSTRIRAGSMSCRFGDHDLVRVIREITTHYGNESDRTRSEILLDVPPALPARFDHARIEQVMVNLISNAFKYAPGTPVKIHAERDREDIVFAVQDSGPGIPSHLHSRIFERFERGEQPASANGLGLGLYIVREIVRAHGGSVSVESEPGRGACFRVRMPAAGASTNGELVN